MTLSAAADAFFPKLLLLSSLFTLACGAGGGAEIAFLAANCYPFSHHSNHLCYHRFAHPLFPIAWLAPSAPSATGGHGERPFHYAYLYLSCPCHDHRHVPLHAACPRCLRCSSPRSYTLVCRCRSISLPRAERCLQTFEFCRTEGSNECAAWETTHHHSYDVMEYLRTNQQQHKISKRPPLPTTTNLHYHCLLQQIDNCLIKTIQEGGNIHSTKQRHNITKKKK